VVAEAAEDLFFDGGESLQEELSDVAERDGVAARDAVLREEAEDFAQGAIDVDGCLELAGRRSDVGRKIRDLAVGAGLRFCAGVHGAERGMRLGWAHAAATAVRELELAVLRSEHGNGRDFGCDGMSDSVHRTS
jgi:hypothetical protein